MAQAEWIGYQMRLELTLESLLTIILPEVPNKIKGKFYSTLLDVITVFVAHLTERVSEEQSLLKLGRCSDTLGIRKNTSGFVSIPLKKGASGARQ